MKDLTVSALFDLYGNLLTYTQREMFDLYYNEDFSLSEIADNFNITRQGVRDAIKRCEFILKNFEEKLGIMNKLEFIEQQVNIIDLANKNIENAFQQKFYNKDIALSIDTISKSIENLKDC